MQPQQYAPQYPVQQQPTAYPPQFPSIPQGYAQPAPMQGYPPQYGQQPYPPQQPAYAPPPQQPSAPLPTGTLDDYFDQPGGGAPSFKFQDANKLPMINKSYIGQVERPITNGDIRAQTDNNGRPLTFKDGRTKWVMIVPMLVQPSPEFPDGKAGWWVKGQARDELARAMAEAGAPEGPPEPGAVIQVTLTGTRQVPNSYPQYLYAIRYQRPAGAPPTLSPQAQPSAVEVAPVVSTATGQPVVHQVQVPPAASAPIPGYTEQVVYAQPQAAPPAWTPTANYPEPIGYMTPDGPVTYDPRQAPQVQQPIPQAQMPAPVVAQAATPPVVAQAATPPVVAQAATPPTAPPAQMAQPAPTAVAPTAVPAGFTPDQAALFAKLTGG